MVEGCDYSFGRPGGAALANAGKHFAVRYLSNSNKGLTKSELADLNAHGIAVALCYEGGAGGALYGATRGSNDASLAEKQRKALGLPELPIYFAVDFDANSGQQGSVDAYLRGAAAVIGAKRVGVYGSYGVVQRCRNNGSAAWFWQTYAWSHNQVLGGIHLYQYKNGQTINGAAVDFCRALQNNYGQTIQTGVEPMFHPAEPMVAIGRFTAADGTVVALGVKEDGAVFCEPKVYYRGGANGKSYFKGKKAALIQDNGQDGYQIIATDGDKYSFPEGTHPV